MTNPGRGNVLPRPHEDAVGPVLLTSNIEDLVAGSGWTVTEGYDISDHGWIVGAGIGPDGDKHAILIVPEPSVLVMVLGLFLGLTAICRG